MKAPDTGVEKARVHAVLAAALLAATALVRVPTELCAASAQDLATAARGTLLVVFAAGVVAFGILALTIVGLPSLLRPWANVGLFGLAIYAWIRSGFFVGPSLSLDGRRVNVDLSTGSAGLLVPVAAAILAAWLGTRNPRVGTTLLAVLLGGSLLESVGMAASVWRVAPPASRSDVDAALEWSPNGNVLIIILDSLQSDVFEDVLESQPRLRQELDGFRYYRLATSSSPTTYLSLPTIHSGKPYDSYESVVQFYQEEVYEGSVLNRLAGAGYRVSYASGVGPCPKAVASCFGIAELARSRGEVALREASQLIDLGIYRVLPDRLRKTVLGRGRGPVASVFGEPWIERAVAEAAALERFASASTVTESPPTAKLLHTMITHRPMLLQPDCSKGERQDDRLGAKLQATCAFRQIAALVERLKVQGVYDVSNVLVIADHGYGFESAFVESRDVSFRRKVGAFNPVVLVKPTRARGSLTTSDAPIQLADIAGALCDEAGCSPAEGLRRLDSVEADRTRMAYWYVWRHQYWKLPRVPGLVQYTIRGDLTKSESWSREAAVYAAGTVIDFRRKESAAKYLGFGWDHRQPTHPWMVDRQATIWLRITREPLRDFELVLQALLDSDSAVPARVDVAVNGVTVGELVSARPASQPQSYRLPVSNHVLLRSEDTTIRFSLPEVGGTSKGDRPTTHLAVQMLELRPRP